MPAAPPPTRSRRLFDALSLLGAVVLGLVLLVAAWGKLLDPIAFAEEIGSQGLAIGLSAASWTVLFLGFEVALGVALLLGVRRLWTLLPASGLVALFLFLTGRAYWRFSQGLIDADESCGCFGSLLQRTPAEAFWQDLVLLVPPLALAFLAPRRGRALDWRAAVAAVAGMAALAFAWRSPELPLDDLATRLSPGVEVVDLCVGAGSERVCLDTLVPELADGEHLVVLAEVEDERLLAATPRLNELASAPEAEEVWLLTPSEEAARQLFLFRAAPAYRVREVPLPLLRPLYRRLPRSFTVNDGRVTETFAGLPPG